MNPTPPNESPRPRRRWPRRLAGVGAALAGGVCIVHFIVMPWVVRRNVEQALIGMGIADPRFEVKRALLWRSTIANLTAADGAIRAESVDVTYRPLKVVAGQ